MAYRCEIIVYKGVKNGTIYDHSRITEILDSKLVR